MSTEFTTAPMIGSSSSGKQAPIQTGVNPAPQRSLLAFVVDEKQYKGKGSVATATLPEGGLSAIERIIPRAYQTPRVTIDPLAFVSSVFVMKYNYENSALVLSPF